MNPAMLEEVEYDSPLYDAQGMRVGSTRYRGRQIGRLAIRTLKPQEMFYDFSGQRYAAPRGYVIDHVPSGASLTNTTTLDDAVLIADELSRFAAADLDALDIKHLFEQIGPDVLGWLQAVAISGGAVIPYREWLAQQESAP